MLRNPHKDTLYIGEPLAGIVPMDVVPRVGIVVPATGGLNSESLRELQSMLGHQDTGMDKMGTIILANCLPLEGAEGVLGFLWQEFLALGGRLIYFGDPRPVFRGAYPENHIESLFRRLNKRHIISCKLSVCTRDSAARDRSYFWRFLSVQKPVVPMRQALRDL